MWIHGVINTKCILEDVGVPGNDSENSRPKLVSVAVDGASGARFFVNGKWHCHKVVHVHALSALIQALEEKRRVCAELESIQVFPTESRIKVAFRLVVFAMDPLKMRVLAPYCASNTESITPGATRFDLDAVLLSSARGQKEFLEQTRAVLPLLDSQDSNMFLIPKDVYESTLVRFLSAKDLRMLNKTCRFFRFIGASYVPGLRPSLFKHQRASLFLMEHQEMDPCSLDEAFAYEMTQTTVEGTQSKSPAAFSEQPSAGNTSSLSSTINLEYNQARPEVVRVDAFSGFARTNLAYPSQRFKRGGLLCDAPGLGKTVAMLSLILRTRGMLANETDSIDDLNDQIIGASKRKTPPREAKARYFSPTSNPMFIQGLTKLKTTLVIVPRALLSHWKHQIELHVEENALRWACMDQPTDAFPSSLESLDVLLISSSRLASEVRRPIWDETATMQSIFASSPLFQVCFLRMVIDEGHVLGASASSSGNINSNNLMQMVRTVRAERFWILTGTPARLSSVQDGLNSLRNTFKFLGAFPPSASSREWSEFLVKGFREEIYPAKHFMVSLLRRIMVRHRKEDVISELPRLERTKTLLRFDRNSRLQYNIFVSFVRTNVLLTSIGSSGGLETSLLHPKNRKQCAELVNNLRLACSAEVNERFKLAIKHQDHVETLEAFQGEPELVQQRVSQYLTRAVGGTLSQCDACGIDVHMLILTRCGHLFCVDCAKFDQCSKCGSLIDADDIAALQPGFSLTRDFQGELDAVSRQLGAKSKWILDRIFEERARFAERMAAGTKPGSKRHQNPGTIQPPKFIVFSQFQSVLNVVGDKLIHSLGQDAVAEFYREYRDLELEKFKSGRVQEWRCSHCTRINTDALSHKCTHPIVTVSVDGGERRTLLRPEEDIVGGFNPRQAHAVNSEMFLRVNPSHNNDEPNQQQQRARFLYWQKCGAKREQENTLYRDVNCDVLLLPKDGSHGLDLSCASHVFLLDVLWDAGLEEQIISRAWRLGNRAEKVVIEQLLMRDTLEDILFFKGGNNHDSASKNGHRSDEEERGILSLLQDDDESSHQSLSASSIMNNALSSSSSGDIDIQTVDSSAASQHSSSSALVNVRTDARLKTVLEQVRLVRPHAVD